MINRLKLRLVKILLQNKIIRLNQTITQLEKIINFFEESEDKNVLLEFLLNEKDLKAIGTIFWLLQARLKTVHHYHLKTNLLVSIHAQVFYRCHLA